MATDVLTTARATEFFQWLDAKDETALRAVIAEDAQGVDELTRGWMRGHSALERYFMDNLPAMAEIHSRLDDLDARRWGDLEVETFMLRQSYVFEGTRYEIEAPTTMIWRLGGDRPKLVLVHSIPLPPRS